MSSPQNAYLYHNVETLRILGIKKISKYNMTKILKSRFPRPGKLILEINKEIKTFHDNLKLKNFMSNKPVL